MPPFCLIGDFLMVVYMQYLLAPWQSVDSTLHLCSPYQLQSHCSHPGDRLKLVQEMARMHRQRSAAGMGWPEENTSNSYYIHKSKTHQIRFNCCCTQVHHSYCRLSDSTTLRLRYDDTTMHSTTWSKLWYAFDSSALWLWRKIDIYFFACVEL